MRAKRKSTACFNCESALLNQENFCPKCGQENHSKQASIKHLFNDFMGDYLTFDSRLSRSIFPLLFEPGKITIDYLDGKRQRYIPPIRVFLFLSFIYFGLAYLTGLNSTDVKINSEESQEVVNAAVRSIQSNFNLIILLYIPLFAFLVRLFFRSEERNFYVNFFVYALHLFSFLFIVATAQILLILLFYLMFAEAAKFVAVITMESMFLLYVLIYTVISLKRVFQKKYTILRFIGVLSISLFAFLGLMLIAILLLFFLNK